MERYERALALHRMFKAARLPIERMLEFSRRYYD